MGTSWSLDYLAALRIDLEDGMAQSVLARLNAKDIRLDPFPHLIAENVLDADYYAELDAAYPALEMIAGPGPLANNKLYSRSAADIFADKNIPEIWRDFFAYHSSQAFLHECLQFWERAIRHEYPDIEDRFGKPLGEFTAGVRRKGREREAANNEADVMLDCQFCMNSPVVTPSSVRVPHVDNPFKLFAGILYFRREDDASTGGDLNLYRLTSDRVHYDRKLNVSEDVIEAAAQVPYRANSAILWLNTPRSLHGVTPRSVTQVPRRFINFIGECYRHSDEGFFPVPRTLSGRAKDALRGLVGTS